MPGAFPAIPGRTSRIKVPKVGKPGHYSAASIDG
jgi:hypothetical protein